MTIVLNGTTGITNDGGYTGDGIIFADTTPANTLVTTTGGNVGIGTSSPTGFGTPNFHINGTTPLIHLTTPTTGTASGDGTQIAVSGSDFQITNLEAGNLVFGTSSAERMRIDSSGRLLVGTTTSLDGNAGTIQSKQSNSGSWPLWVEGVDRGIVVKQTATSGFAAYFLYNSTNTGSISTTTTSTSYNTSSDYRLKENIAPMTGALAKVAQLKPCTYTWKSTGDASQGFIAHELQAVVPDCVTGEKDAVDAEGNPQYQGIDTSFLVATLTAAIQEQQAIITDLKSRIETLEAK